MSCELKNFAKIPDLKRVQEYLGFSGGMWLIIYIENIQLSIII